MRRQDYTVGWICAVQTEVVAACELLDEGHPLLSTDYPHDDNTYILGRIGKHNIVIACLPKGRYGIASAASVAKDMLRSFESIRIGLMVGIGGGAPSDKHDIRLGDVVVGCPIKKEGGVVSYNYGKAVQDQEFERTGSLNSPPTVLLTVLTKLSADHERNGSYITESVRLMITKNPRLRGKYQHPGAEHDRLYESSYTHRAGDHRCETGCDSTSPPLLRRPRREFDPDEPVVHYGLIASADRLMKDAIARDRLIKEHDILCFEMEAAGLMNDFPCVVIRGICDYSDSHKNDAWQGYAAVTAASYAKELLGIIPEHQIACTQTATAEMAPALLASDEDTNLKYHSTTAEEVECLQSLWPRGIDYESQKNQNPRRVLDTCLWTLENSKYIKWRDDDTTKLLWISADPGCGKSVLARCIIDEDLPKVFRNNTSKRILYYFFKDTSPEQRSATRAISAILHQLFASQPRLIRYALPSYREIGKALSTTFPKLWSIFAAAATDPLAGNAVCVLDALDECDERGQPELIKALEDFCLHQRSPSSASNLKLLITSRPYFQIRREFDKLLQASDNIELAGNDESASIKKEIDLVIKHNVAKLASENRLTQRVSDHLEKRLLETENRTYLWLHLIWEIIKKNLSGTIREMNELIDNLPSDIQDSYEILLQRCPNYPFAKKVLQIVLVAGRPLTLDEINLAIGINEQTSSYADLELEESLRLQETLPSRCGLMVSIIGSKVYFIHQTVKEFLLGEVGTKYSARRTWQQSLDLGESHHLMAEICLRSISFSEIQLDQANLCNALLPGNAREMEPNAYCRSFVFLSYSAIYWAEHSRDQKDSNVMKIIEHCLESSDCRSIIGRWRRDYGTTLHAASLGGHEKIVQMLLDKGADVHAQGGIYGNALQAASVEGHDQVMQILLDKGADVNAQGGYYGNALQAASIGGHDKVVQMLLDKGADVNAQGGYHGNALYAASLGGYDKVVQMLLDKGADINAQGGFYGNALQAASGGGYDQVVQMLLDKGADVHAQGGLYGNALQAASVEGHDQVVQMLLDKGANINAQGARRKVERITTHSRQRYQEIMTK